MNVVGEWIIAPHGADWDEWCSWAEAMPVSRQLGVRCVRIGPGFAEVRLERSDWPLNPNGAVHGGLVVAWADHCFGIVAMTALGEGLLPATATLTSEFLRPATPPLTFDCAVERVGQTLLFVKVDVRNGRGKIAAKVSGTMAVDGSSRFRPG